MEQLTLEQRAELLEEYKVCRESADTLEDNVWKTASVLSVGSIAGIVLVFEQGVAPPVIFGVSLLAITTLWTWWRMAIRWRSVGHTMLRRMQHIELLLGDTLRSSLYVRYLTEFKVQEHQGERATIRWKQDTPKEPSILIEPALRRELQHDLCQKDFLDSFEYRGNKHMLLFLVWVQTVAWGVVGA